MKIVLVLVSNFAFTPAFANIGLCYRNEAVSKAKVVHTYCRCSEAFGIQFERIEVLSNGETKKTLTIQVSPENGAYFRDEVFFKCQMMVSQCK
jgi:hypothetical protein